MVNNRLLLIEDDFDVAEMLLLYFKAQEYDVLHASNGTDGIEIARTKFPNLILLDVMLPDMDGYEVCYRLRHIALTKYIPILFLTQRDGRASKVKGLELGADDYITKPFDIDELRLRVVNAISRATREHLYETRSGLPAASLIMEERQRRGRTSRELVFRLHGFQAYSDVHGFMAASDVLYHAGRVIREVLSENGRQNDFVGVDENTFIVLTAAEQTQSLEMGITERFNEQVRAFYSFADADRGGLLLDEGTPEERFVPMMSLTTGDPAPLNNRPTESSSFDW